MVFSVLIFYRTVEQNNVTNNLLDFSSFETTNVNNVGVAQPPVGEILQPLAADNIPITPTNGKLSNEDNLNFNSQPFIAFQDNKKQDSNTVNGEYVYCCKFISLFILSVIFYEAGFLIVIQTLCCW